MKKNWFILFLSCYPYALGLRLSRTIRDASYADRIVNMLDGFLVGNAKL